MPERLYVQAAGYGPEICALYGAGETKQYSLGVLRITRHIRQG